MSVSDRPLIDQAARTRLLTDLDSTFFVEAGAGTGKTKTLVDRIVNLVAKGRVRMEQLAAITFTDAAAAELRDRVREGLERAAEGMMPRTGPEEDPSPEERERCRVAAGEIDSAAIRTIHAFAGHLLRTYPLEVGLPPGFSTLDEIDQEALFEERFREWFWGTALEAPARDVLRRAFLLGLTQQHLRDMAVAFEGQHDLLTSTTSWTAESATAAVPIAQQAGRDLLDLAPLLQYANDGPDDPLAKVVLTCQSSAQRLVAVGTEEQALASLIELGVLKTPGNQKNWQRLPDNRNACAVIKGVVKGVADVVAVTLASQRASLLPKLLGLLRDFTLAGVAARRSDGVATFQDVLAWARDLLRNHPEVRARAQQQYQRIFVDEFQDTDPLQAEIAFYLAAKSDAELPLDWRDILLAPGKLFIVGDPKQSIYRFRRADIGVYDSLLRRLEDCQERLVQNFRSVSAVIEWVNHHFLVGMVEAEGIQPPYVALAARWGNFDDSAPCGVYRIGQAGDGNAAATATVEAGALVGLAQSAVTAGWLVSDRAADGSRVLRAARYRDICILIPSRTHLRRLERALEDANVPYRVESGKLVLATQEVRDLLACLRAIEDPSDQVALVGALRSAAFSCTDPDLLRWVEGGGRLDYERPGAGPDGPLKDALACLASFHARRQALSPPALIDAFLRERMLEAAVFAEPRPRESWRRLRYVATQARAFTATGRHTLRAFLEWIAGLERAEVREAESAEAEPDEDAVRILTIHKAKGLEFPIVLLAGLGNTRGGGSSSIEVIPDRESGALACRIGADWRTDDFEEARTHEDQRAEAEAIRLLYVAATRARDHLVLSLYRGARAGTSAAARIETRLEGTDGLCQSIEPTVVGPSPPTVTAASDLQSVASWGSRAFEDDWLQRRRDLIQSLATPPLISSDLDWLDDVNGAEDDELALTPSPVHRASLASDVRRLLRSPSGAMPDDADPLATTMVLAIRSSTAYSEALSRPSCQRGVALLGTIDGVLLDLSADLVYETPDGAVLVGYDLGDLASLDDGDRREHVVAIRERGASLALAFLAATGQAPLKVEIVRAIDGQVTRLDDVPDLIAEARARIARMSLTQAVQRSTGPGTDDDGVRADPITHDRRRAPNG
jgi:ATP-dependent helicase/nuclease subunit A